MTRIQTYAAAKAPPKTGHWFRCCLAAELGRQLSGDFRNFGPRNRSFESKVRVAGHDSSFRWERSIVGHNRAAALHARIAALANGPASMTPTASPTPMVLETAAVAKPADLDDGIAFEPTAFAEAMLLIEELSF